MVTSWDGASVSAPAQTQISQQVPSPSNSVPNRQNSKRPELTPTATPRPRPTTPKPEEPKEPSRPDLTGLRRPSRPRFRPPPTQKPELPIREPVTAPRRPVSAPRRP